MYKATRNVIVAALVSTFPLLASAQQGTCAHNEMRTWVDAEEICYHTHGPLSESWNIHNQANQDALEGCLQIARSEYKDKRMICEMRGETPYRKDGIHKEWERYAPGYEDALNRLGGDQ
ncbi:MAG: hypothetical protein ACI8W8_004558 [Rhodothermales bacterium]|jgi:hypothetical protein